MTKIYLKINYYFGFVNIFSRVQRLLLYILKTIKNTFSVSFVKLTTSFNSCQLCIFTYISTHTHTDICVSMCFCYL